MRKDGWELMLEAYLEKAKTAQWQWGTFDCLIFAADWCKELTGIDPMAYKKKGDPITIRGAYANQSEALRLIAKLRGSMHAIFDAHFKRALHANASRGDVCLAELPTGNCFGIVVGKYSAFKTADAGLVLVPTSKANAVWALS